jgi:hypothetical protein
MACVAASHIDLHPCRYGREGVQAASQGGEEDFGSFQHAEDIFREFFGGHNPFDAFEDAM